MPTMNVFSNSTPCYIKWSTQAGAKPGGGQLPWVLDRGGAVGRSSGLVGIRDKGELVPNHGKDTSLSGVEYSLRFRRTCRETTIEGSLRSKGSN